MPVRGDLRCFKGGKVTGRQRGSGRCLLLTPMQERLEKEKKLTKDLGQAATKLQELLKVTQDQLAKERETVKKLKEQLQETVLVVAAAIPPLDAGRSCREEHVRQWFKTRGKVALAFRDYRGGFWEALGPHKMVVMVLPAQKAGLGPSVKHFHA